MLKKQYSKTKPTCKVTFTLAKDAIQGAQKVTILGEFNNWNPSLGIPMKLTGNEFKAVIELPTGRDYQFRYLADNGVWENDWAADGYVEVPFDVCNSVVSLLGKKAAAKVSSSIGKAKATTNSKKANAISDTKVKSSATPKTKAKTSTAKKAKADDLKKIEGIGPKIAGILAKEGIKTFADLGAAKKTTLKAILEAAGNRYKMHDPSTWAKQAKIAAKGDWAKLKTLQAALNGGKKK